MGSYIIRRVLILPLLLAGVTVMVFAMMSLLTPYERAALYVQDIPKRQGAIDAIRRRFHLALVKDEAP